MTEYILKSTLVAEIEKAIDSPAPSHDQQCTWEDGYWCGLYTSEGIIDTLKVKDPYEQYVQYDSIKAGIQAHAETYSFNIESELFNQLTEEQQKLWRKEIEQAVISGGEVGVELAKDIRYKENVEVKEVDIDVMQRMEECPYRKVGCTMYEGKILECNGTCSWVSDFPRLKELKAQKGESYDSK